MQIKKFLQTSGSGELNKNANPQTIVKKYSPGLHLVEFGLNLGVVVQSGNLARLLNIDRVD